MIACLYLPTFAITVEEGCTPALRHQPTLLIQYRQGKGTIFAASEDVQRAGVTFGMPLKRAVAYAPDAHLIPAALHRYQRALRGVVEVLREYANKIEVVRLYDRQPEAICYLDLGKLRKADALFIAARLKENLHRHTGLTARIGMAKGKFTAYIAARTQRETRVIAPEEEAAFLAPFPVQALPLGKEIAHQLHLLGIKTLGQLVSLPRSGVFAQFGKRGVQLYDLAAGKDTRRLRSVRFDPQERLTHAFEPPVEDRQVLEAVLCQLAQQGAERLSKEGYTTRQITLVLTLEDFTQVEKTLQLYQPMGESKALFRALCYLTHQMVIACRVNQVEVLLDDLRQPMPRQLSLFDNPTEHPSLGDVLIDLIPRYGVEPFFEITPHIADAPLPERRFRLENIALEAGVVA